VSNMIDQGLHFWYLRYWWNSR